MLTGSDVQRLVSALAAAGYSQDIEWSEGVSAPDKAEVFAAELIYVICNSGMRFTVARGIYDRVCEALAAGKSASTAFGHKGKAAAIDGIWKNRQTYFSIYNNATDKIAFLRNLPWIGGITAFHAAKNLGVDCCKPDVHLTRLATVYGTTPEALCKRLAIETGYRVATVDLILWRACAIGLLDSRAGVIRPEVGTSSTLGI